jgi:hypothetical protein
MHKDYAKRKPLAGKTSSNSMQIPAGLARWGISSALKATIINTHSQSSPMEENYEQRIMIHGLLATPDWALRDALGEEINQGEKGWKEL